MNNFFIKTISINTNKTHPFPYNISAIKFAKHLNLANSITIFAGDNGCGKSTLLETIALKLNLPLIGGFAGDKKSFEAAHLLAPYLHFEWSQETSAGFFFRAEDFSDFIYQNERAQQSAEASIAELRNVVSADTFKQISEGMNYNLHRMKEKYGENMQAFSHGEAYLTILQSRINSKGIFLLDEPEAALSPLKQLSLISFITDIQKKYKTQFIIATHSPILMGLPGAYLYEIQETGISHVEYEETEHYRITKSFLDNPKQYLRYL